MCMWLLIHAGITVKPCYQKGPLIANNFRSTSVWWESVRFMSDRCLFKDFCYLEAKPRMTSHQLDTFSGHLLKIISHLNHCNLTNFTWRFSVILLAAYFSVVKLGWGDSSCMESHVVVHVWSFLDQKMGHFTLAAIPRTINLKTLIPSFTQLIIPNLFGDGQKLSSSGALSPCELHYYWPFVLVGIIQKLVYSLHKMPLMQKVNKCPCLDIITGY